MEQIRRQAHKPRNDILAHGCLHMIRVYFLLALLKIHRQPPSDSLQLEGVVWLTEVPLGINEQKLLEDFALSTVIEE
jgi:hypothetical protein